MKIKDEQGNEIEVFTSKEVEDQIKAAQETARTTAVEEYKKENPDKAGEITDLQTKLSEAEALLKAAEAAGGNDGQVARLRKERDDAKAAEAAATKGIDEKLDAIRKEFAGDEKKTLLDSLSAGDADLRAKLELEFDRYNPSDTSKEGVRARMAKAYTLVTDKKPAPGIFDGTISGGGGGGNGGGYRPAETKEVTTNQRNIGNVLGITDKDREDYAKFQAQQEALKAQGLIPR